MHLVSRRRQVVHVAGEPFTFERGEPIVTEHCYKHSPKMLEALLRESGWRVRDVYPDPRGRMRLWHAER
jgi:L-histidine N-alpha-methyltransferase